MAHTSSLKAVHQLPPTCSSSSFVSSKRDSVARPCSPRSSPMRCLMLSISRRICTRCQSRAEQKKQRGNGMQRRQAASARGWDAAADGMLWRQHAAMHIPSRQRH